MAFEAIIFDVDGVLANSETAISRCFIHTLVKHGFPAPKTEKVQKSVGHDAKTWIKNLLPKNKKDNDKLVETLVAYSRNAYREVYMPILIKPAKNAVETVKKLQEDFDVAIATNNPRDTTIKLLKILELDGIKTIVSSDDVENPKPAPDVLVKAMKELNRAPENCLYIGDSYLDVQAAKSAKIKIALVTHAYNKDLESNYRVNDLTQICSIAKN